MRVALACLLACLTTIAGLAAAEGKALPYPPGRSSFRSYGTETGLGNLSVQALLQDREGYLWAGTEDGLYRYDGREFQRFDLRQGLPSTLVTRLLQTGDGTLWVGTFSGLARKIPGGRFEGVGGQVGLPVEAVTALQVGSDGRLWVGQRSGLQVGTEGRGFQLASGWPGGEATALSAEAGGRLWAAAWSGSGAGRAQVRSWDGRGWKEWSLPGLGPERVNEFARDGEGRLWVRTASRLWVREGEGEFRPFPLPTAMPGTWGSLGIDRKGHLLLPTAEGLFIREGAAWQRLGPSEGFPVEWARVALEDREGSLWIGSRGLHRQLGGGVWRSYTSRDGLPSEVARTIFQDREGELWVGTDKGLVRAHSGGFTRLPGTEGNVVRSVQEGPDGRFYLAGLPVEVLRTDPRTGRIERFGREAGLRGKRIFRMLLDPEGVLWVATDGGGLLSARTGQGPLRFEPVVLPQGDPYEYVSGLALDGQGRLWVAGERGLAVLEKGAWRRFTGADGLKQTHAAYVLARRNGDLVLAYFEATGLSRIRYEGGRLSVGDLIPPSSGLHAQKVYMMGEDRAGRLWVGTGQGVFLFAGGMEEHYGAEDGLVGEDVNNMAFLEDRQGSLWIGTLAGLARFDARTQVPTPPPPATVLLATALGARAWDGPPPEGLRLGHRENALEVRFAGLSFQRENAVESQTRLVGLEPEWRGTRSRELRIPALPPGDYRFEVRSRIGQGPWGPVQGFGFRISPAWWQGWAFRLGAAAGLLGLGWLLHRFRLQGLSRRNAQLEAVVSERTRALQSANEALRAQSLTDPLTGLHNRRFLGACLPEDLALVNRTHRELRGGNSARTALNVDIVFLMVDLDRFKAVNDRYGHAAGDGVLQQMAEILRGATRDSDSVIRWGGEEFLVVGRNTCRRDCSILAERIRARVEAHRFALPEGGALNCTCSLGFAFYPLVGDRPDHVFWEQVVDLADRALYAAKRGGRNAWVGLLPRTDLRAGQIAPAPAQDLRTLISLQDLEVVTSLPEGTALEWEPLREEC